MVGIVLGRVCRLAGIVFGRVCSLVGFVFGSVCRLVGFVLGRVVVWVGLSWGGGVWGMFFDDFIFNLIRIQPYVNINNFNKIFYTFYG